MNWDKPCEGCGGSLRIAGGRAWLPVEPDDRGPFRYAAPVCETCLGRLDADMWVMESHWRGIGPRVPFEKLPLEQPK